MARIYKDTRVDLRPYSSTTVVNIPIPTQESATRRARFSISALTDNDLPVAKDEDEFSKRHLATQGSLYFRKRKLYPRSFLWRVVNDNRVLEIHCVDLAKAGIEHHEYNVTLRLDFQEEILPCGVEFADLEEHEAINVFVITASKQLHTLTLRPEFFRRVSAIDDNVSEWCKTCVPAPLAFSYPHRLHASSPLELFVSLDNGSLLRLTRRAGDDGSNWSPLTFDERTWGSSIRGLVRWHTPAPVKYRGRNLDHNVPNAIATTSDQTYVFVVCLNHTLKIWNLATNKLVASKDLLDRQVQQNEANFLSLNPTESSFIRVFNAERALDGEYRYYVVTYSPFEDGRFKFWAVKGGLTSQLVIEDLYPNAPLRPVDPDTTGNMFWSIADFQIKSAEAGKGMELWVLWSNNSLCQLYTLHFNFDTLERDWHTNWVSTAIESRRQEPPPVMVSSDVVDPTEKWLKYLLQPNRFTPEVLETALAIYYEALRPLASTPHSFKKNASLPERLCTTIAATVSLRKYADDHMDFPRYPADTDSKWRQFWQTAEDINRRRFEPVSLAYDAYSETPWLLLSDNCAVIRECSSTELLVHNTGFELRSEGAKIVDRWSHRDLGSEVGELFEQASHLMKVASGFRKRFPAELEAACWGALEAEIFTEPSSSVPDRIDAFRERCDFGERVSNKIFDGLFAAMNEHLNINDLPSEIFYTILDTIPLGHGKDSDLLATHFGARVTVNGVQETISQTRQLLVDLLVLVVFIDSEVDQEKGSTFDAADLFSAIISLLREYEMMYWLSSNVRKCTGKPVNDATDGSGSPFSLKKDTSSNKDERVATILEDLFASDIKPRQAIGRSQSYTLTLGIRDVLSWVTRQGEVAYPNALAYIQCDLIAKDNIELAWDFLRFQANTSWAAYVKGRLYVAMSEYDTAALYFRKAAYLLSCGKPLGNLHEMSSTLLDIVSVDCFHNGLPKYFQHILSIFEQVRSFSHVADFASLALQTLESELSEQDPEYSVLRTDLLSRLFHASLKTCHFDEAYSALTRYKDVALQRSALNSLIMTVLAASGPGSTGLQQILHFPTSLVPNLASYVDETLVSLAKKQTSFNTFLETENNKWVDSTPDYQRILQAYRIARGDYRGAAEIAYRNVQRLRHGRDNPSSHLALIKGKDADDQKPMVEEDDPESQEIRHELLSLINLLACVDKSESYILVEREDPSTQPGYDNRPRSTHADDDGNISMDDVDTNSPTVRRPSSNASRPSSSSVHGNGHGHGHGQPQKPQKRVIVTLDHLRREYQGELDRVSRIERGDWEFGALGEDEEEDVDGDETMVIS